MLEFLGFLLTSLLSGLYIIYKLKQDGLPAALQRRLNKSSISDWQRKLTQRLPKYYHNHNSASKKINESGVIAQELEYVLERPSPSLQGADDICFYGSDSEGNVLFAKITKIVGGWTSAQLSVKVNQTSYTVQSQGMSTSKYEFTLGNFKIEMAEPFRVWRIWYNGPLKTQGSSNLVHGVINCLWKPLDHPFDSMKDASKDLLNEEILRNDQKNALELASLLNQGYSQFGSLHGTLKISGQVDREDSTQIYSDKTVYLHGFRHKRFLPLHKQYDNNGQTGNRLELFGFCASNGVAFRLQGFQDMWVDGQIFYPGKDMNPVFSIESPSRDFQNDLTVPKLFTINGSKTSLVVEVWPKLDKLTGEPVKPILLRLNINGKAGHGLLLRNFDGDSSTISLLNNSEFLTHQIKAVQENEKKFIVKEDLINFLSKGSTDVSLVGGKGASLARLAQLEQDAFKTAKGFSVTTNLFRRMIDLSKITKVFDTSFCGDDPSLEKSCSAAMEIIKLSNAREELQKLLPSFLAQTFGQSRSSNIRYAVRSSGILEDGAELSCAGQNETFLGVEEQAIPEKVILCWCSLFTPQSVLYRLNHGQPAVSEIAVVVQEMVDAASAGVMFTADPRTGNPFEMLVTANFGLGESVVSAACDPDTFILNKIPSNVSINSQFPLHDVNRIKIISRTLGEKKSKIVMSGSATKEEHLSESDTKRFSAEDSSLLKLGEIGVQLETQLGNMKPVDIEWAISKTGEIYILQSRAMTSLDSWTDFEITHEFDSGLRSNFEVMTRANTGEVMPKAIYPIGIQASGRLIDIGVQEVQATMRNKTVCPFVSKCSPIFGQKIFLSVIDTLYAFLEDNPQSPTAACTDLTVFGRPVLTKEMFDQAKERYSTMGKLDSLLGLKMTIGAVRQSTALIERAEATYKDLKLDYSSLEQTSEKVFMQITKDLGLLQDIMYIHCAMSRCSSSTLVIAFMFLTEKKEVKDWSPSLYEDAGKILSAYSAVESAEIPVDINNLGTTIVEHGVQPEVFLTFDKTHEAMGWLRSNSIIDKALREFLKKHGHRSVAELDLGQTSWKKDPTELVVLLKNVVRGRLELRNNSESSHSTPKSSFLNEDQLLASLKTPLKSGSKKLLKFILPYCRRSVAFREKSKSLSVRVLSLLKEGYYLLGDLMAKEQLIPASELIIYLTHHEMGMLIKRDPASTTILYKAMRRSKLYSLLNKTEYPELCVGYPKPIDKSEKIEIVDVIRGTPVSSGTVKGIAKVCLSVEEASELIYPGDILITKGTDIAWSPFFPIISGVVTELGGLISHGAVVAREYGLPCLVGAVNATKIFQTGDEVILDTTTGTLTKVKTL